MKILEVRDSFIKIETSENILQSGFFLIEDIEKSYIAQVIQLKQVGERKFAFAKLLALYNGAISEYDGNPPALDSKVKLFDFKLLSKIFDYKTPIVAGKFILDGRNIPIDVTYLDKKLLVSIDSNESNETIVSNFAKQFKNSIIIDTLGIFTKNKVIAGKDFKLPLNSSSLSFIYEDCLTDATSDSKTLIKEIFQELSEYSKTVDFLPFTTLKNIVDEMVEKSHVFKLLVLKNKLAKFDKLGYFASTLNEVENLKTILSTPNMIIDLSKLDANFQNRYLNIIYSELENLTLKPQIFLEASNSLNKKTLKQVLTSELPTTFITHSRFKYIKEIKSLFSNFVIEPTFTNIEAFKNLSIFLNQMSSGTYLFVGESTNNIPLVSTIESFENFTIEEVIEDEIKKGLITIEENSSEQEIEPLEELQPEAQNEAPDPSFIAINEKSESLIEKLSEELNNDKPDSSVNIFENEAETIDETEVLIIEDETASNQNIEEEIVLENSENIEEVTEIEENITEELLNQGDFEESSSNLEESAVIEQETEQEDFSEESNSEKELFSQSFDEFHTSVDEIQTIEISEEISELTENLDTDELEDVNISNEIEEYIAVEDENTDIGEHVENIEENIETTQEIEEYSTKEFEVLPLDTDLSESEEFVELDVSEMSDTDIIIDFEDENLEELQDEEALDKAIIEDVDKVFTTIKEDEISDTDLDFIDELNNSVEEANLELTQEFEEIPEIADLEESDNFLEPLEEINDSIEEVLNEEDEEKDILETRNSNTPIVPVYGADIPAEDTVVSDPIEQGDSVVHAKYGNGIVEKMIKYGTKILYSINFDNVGRRLLDPTLTEIKKA